MHSLINTGTVAQLGPPLHKGGASSLPVVPLRMKNIIFPSVIYGVEIQTSGAGTGTERTGPVPGTLESPSQELDGLRHRARGQHLLLHSHLPHHSGD